MAQRYGRFRSLIRFLTLALVILPLAIVGGGCGKGIFSSSSSSSGSGGSSGTARSVYVTNFGDGLVSALNRNTAGVLNSPATISAGSKNGPIGLAVTPKKTALYAANAADQTIKEFTLSSNGNLSSLSTITTGTNPQQPVVTPNGSYAYSINEGGSISEYTVNATTGKLAANSPASTTNGLTTPLSGVATNSYLYVTDQNGGTGVVLTFKINSNGTLASGPSSTPSLGVIGGPASPNQILIDPSHTWVFVSDGAAGVVSLFKVNGNGLTFIKSYATSATTPNLTEAGLAYVKKGANIFIYCADQTADSVSVFLFTPALPSLTLTGTSPVASVNTPVGLAPAGNNLYVTNNGTGTITGFDINTASGALTNPTSVATESPGNPLSAPEAILLD